MKNLLIWPVAMAIVLGLAACTQNQAARHWGGTTEINLPPGQKFVTVTWEQQDLWYVTRPMRAGETAETLTMKEQSNFGLMQGTIIIHESK